MSVKTIFKVLIGTIILIVVASAVVELFNISTTGLQINQTTKLAGKQACVLFSQETYKQYTDDGGTGGSINQTDTHNINGTTYVTGKFYDSTNPADIYTSLYTSDAFKQWLKTDEIAVKGRWYNLKRIDQALNNPYSLNIPFGHDGYDDAMTAKLYKEVMMTPSNLGIPYLDKTTLTKMFKWNLAQLLSNCNPNSILVDDSGRSYISFRGFRVYADLATISNIEYKTFDLTDPSQRVEFNRITNINPDNLGFQYDNNLQKTINSNEDERTRVCLVGVSYNIPMTYQGITPLKQIFNYIWNTEVDGINGGSGRLNHQQWNESLGSLQSGGLSGNAAASGVLPVPGKLIYYIIR